MCALLAAPFANGAADPGAGSRPGRRLGPPCWSAFAVEGVDDRARDAASFGHLVAVSVGPFPDGLVLVAVRPAGCSSGCATCRDAACAAAAEAGRGGEVGIECLAELAG